MPFGSRSPICSISGVAHDTPLRIHAGLAISVLGVGVYTLILMFNTVLGPPSGIELRGFETIAKVKPATFRPSSLSKTIYAIAFVMFSVGCVMVVLGFRRRVLYMWIPGYALSVIAFLTYTMTVMYGPLDIKPGALIVAFPDDCAKHHVDEEDSPDLDSPEWKPHRGGHIAGTHSAQPRDAETPGSAGGAASARRYDMGTPGSARGVYSVPSRDNRTPGSAWLQYEMSPSQKGRRHRYHNDDVVSRGRGEEAKRTPRVPNVDVSPSRPVINALKKTFPPK
ncbi:uncharacterized protein LOC135398890 isoform X2 [Ornithodoros turicata]|uniref:uncharacterized protein LOC135398890 isoform X2 n=1 Tax=Ornithodoros turicata TaxID=34597 RepID=UPI0031394076